MTGDCLKRPPHCGPISEQIWASLCFSNMGGGKAWTDFCYLCFLFSLNTNPSVIPGIAPIIVRFIIRNKNGEQNWVSWKRKEPSTGTGCLLFLLSSSSFLQPFEEWNEWKAETKTRDKRQWLYVNMRRCFNFYGAPFVCSLVVILLFVQIVSRFQWSARRQFDPETHKSIKETRWLTVEQERWCWNRCKMNIFFKNYMFHEIIGVFTVSCIWTSHREPMGMFFTGVSGSTGTYSNTVICAHHQHINSLFTEYHYYYVTLYFSKWNILGITVS